MSRSLLKPSFIRAYSASTPITASGTLYNGPLPLAESYSLVVNAGTVTGTSPTLDIVCQTSYDNGATYINLPLKLTQLTGTGQVMLRWQPTLGFGEAASAVTLLPTGPAIAANGPHNPSYFRIYASVTGTTPSFAADVFLVMVPRQDSIA